MTQNRKKISAISALHYAKLVLRSSLLIAMLVFYIINRAKAVDTVKNSPHILTVIWIIFVVEMILRFFPSKLESMGCQKQFKHNYKPFDEKFLHRMYSVSKSFVAIAVGVAVTEGLISLDDVICDYFPEFKNGNIDEYYEN